MKKILIALLAVLVIAGASVYLFIPAHLNMSSIAYVKCPDNAVGRILNVDADWKNWWPGTVMGNGGAAEYTFNKVSFRPTERTFNGTKLSTTFASSTIEGTLVHAKSSYDSSVILWQYAVKVSNNPLSRLLQYREMKSLKKRTDAILASLKTFLENTDKVYGISIREIRVVDTLLLSSYFESPAPPDMQTVYRYIDQLKQYISAAHATETSFPMLNVSRLSEQRYKTRVAIPIDHNIPVSGRFEIKKMVPGRILVSEIKGGPSVIESAFAQFRHYLSDYDLASPAIPFESLVTNRLPVSDSAGWITRIFYPIL